MVNITSKFIFSGGIFCLGINMKFYVNEIKQELKGLKPLKDNEYYVGLFLQCETKGEGSFSGYYASEKYLDTYLVAYCKYKGNYLEKRIGEIVLTSKHFSEVQVRSHLVTKVIEASNIKKAVEKLKNNEYRQWDCELDEINTNKIL